MALWTFSATFAKSKLFIMKRILTLCVLIMSLTTALGQNRDDAADSVWHELIDNSETMASLQSLKVEIQSQIKQKMPAADSATLDEVGDTITALIDDYTETVVLPVYKRHFTLDEAREINAFYRTPIGRKLHREHALIIKDLSTGMADFSVKLNNKVMAILGRLTKK